MNPQLRQWLAYMPAAVVAAGIAVLSLMEVTHAPAVHLNDKLMHGILYTALAAALMGGLATDGYKSCKWMLMTCLISTAYGALMELLQHYCTLTRSGEMVDIYADAIGAIIGAAIVWQIINLKSKI